MFRFSRERILPLFLQTGMTVTELAHKAGVAYQSAQRAVDGEKVGANIIGKIASALNIDPMQYLGGEKKMFSKKTATITRDDGTKADVTLYVDDSDNLRGYWGEDADALKAYSQYRAGFIATVDVEKAKKAAQ